MDQCRASDVKSDTQRLPMKVYIAIDEVSLKTNNNNLNKNLNLIASLWDI